jgi:hypothetical protein
MVKIVKTFIFNLMCIMSNLNQIFNNILIYIVLKDIFHRAIRGTNNEYT